MTGVDISWRTRVRSSLAELNPLAEEWLGPHAAVAATFAFHASEFSVIVQDENGDIALELHSMRTISQAMRQTKRVLEALRGTR